VTKNSIFAKSKRYTNESWLSFLVVMSEMSWKIGIQYSLLLQKWWLKNYREPFFLGWLVFTRFCVFCHSWALLPRHFH